jgi:hypothetical protein
MFYCANINTENVVVGISELKGEVTQDDIIPISSYDESLLGKIWNGVSFEDAPEPDRLFIHLAMTGGDGRDPIGIQNNGIDALNVVATFRQSESPSSAVITAIDGASWRITVRNAKGDVYDIVDVAFTAGVASFAYTTNNKPDVCRILEADFEQIEISGTTYQLKLIGDSTFKVYRQL